DRALTEDEALGHDHPASVTYACLADGTWCRCPGRRYERGAPNSTTLIWSTPIACLACGSRMNTSQWYPAPPLMFGRAQPLSCASTHAGFDETVRNAVVDPFHHWRGTQKG